ncbi:SRPBCC family protein [Tessaracoccus sp. OS52]|uniref:SRPBCC family protein n=1 Tax=Tessaracoccus sp. OS52 TaxID=2886691 RepID=UPI001D10F511|nr:SRPBCC family protein [Tessaracoccus sp. OS52]MCC2593928.1 SRPBCC family protein [Tessaracoccus sp. OS52]
MTTPTTPLGTKQLRDGRSVVEFTRIFNAPIEDVWAAVTEPDRLARWVGTWHGDPAEGRVQFRMLYEGEDVPEEALTIEECEAPQLLRVTSVSTSEEGPQVWHFRLDLCEDDGVTTLTFSQDVPEPGLAEGVGPGWHYYLDRLVVAEAGGEPADVVWDDYYPALAEHYRGQFA